MSEDSGKDSVPTKRTPAHGHGKLYVGGVPGNKGNRNALGRPKHRIREVSALSFEKRIPVLEDIADDTDARDGDRIRATEVLGRLGLHSDGIDEDFVRDMAAVVGEVLGRAENGEELLAEIYEGWKPVIGKRL